MNKIIFSDGTSFLCPDEPAEIITDYPRTRSWRRITVTGSYAAMSAAFVDGAVYRRDWDSAVCDPVTGLPVGTEVLSEDLSEYCVAGEIVDTRDGNITVYMGHKTDEELENDRIGAVIPELAAMASTLGNGSADNARKLASTVAPAVDMVGVRAWTEGMTTNPGDAVWDRQGRCVYLYTGAVVMTHANPLFFPGCIGVYYWSIVPEMHDGARVWPEVEGVVLAVRNGEVWWTADRTVRYVWAGADNSACSWYPGQDGVHAWERVEG